MKSTFYQSLSVWTGANLLMWFRKWDSLSNFCKASRKALFSVFLFLFFKFPPSIPPLGAMSHELRVGFGLFCKAGLGCVFLQGGLEVFLDRSFHVHLYVQNPDYFLYP